MNDRFADLIQLKTTELIAAIEAVRTAAIADVIAEWISEPCPHRYFAVAVFKYATEDGRGIRVEAFRFAGETEPQIYAAMDRHLAPVPTATMDVAWIRREGVVSVEIEEDLRAKIDREDL